MAARLLLFDRFDQRARQAWRGQVGGGGGVSGVNRLHHWRDALLQFLPSLRLTIHENRAQPRPVEQGMPFLGFTVYPTHRRLKRSKGISYQRHLKILYRRYRAGEITREQGFASVMAWIGHIQHGDTYGLRRKLFQEIIA